MNERTMGLIDKEIEVVLNGRNIKHYESLGYEMPKTEKIYRNKNRNNHICKRTLTITKGEKIFVKQSDLMDGSSVMVDVECDCCKDILNIAYKDYKSHNHNGKYYCIPCSAKIFNSGEKGHLWNTNKTDEERERGRTYPEYTKFIKSVMARDKYVCQCCGKDAEAVHHLYAYSEYKELRTDVTNGIALCDNCHDSFHNWHINKFGYAEKGKNTKEQFEVWVGYTINILAEYNGELPTARQIYCIEEDKIYHSCKELSDNWGMSNITQICKACNRNEVKSVKGKHILWLDNYKKMSQDDIKAYLKECKNNRYSSVICLTTNEIFEVMADAKRKYNARSISNVCTGKGKTSGKLPDGTKLQWMYLKDFIEQNKENINDIDEYVNQHMVKVS